MSYHFTWTVFATRSYLRVCHGATSPFWRSSLQRASQRPAGAATSSVQVPAGCCCYHRRHVLATSSNTRGQQQQQQQRTITTVVVALSGGVDSSVVAALLQHKQQQLEHLGMDHSNNNDDKKRIQLQALHMTNWNFQDPDVAPANNSTTRHYYGQQVACYEQDWKDAVRVAEHLHLPITRQRLEAEYWNTVFEPYLNDLVHEGIMGNPDINCNMYIKFGALRERIMARHGPNTWLATGHYARLWYPSLRHRQQPTISKQPLEQLDQDMICNLPSGFLQDYTNLIEERLSGRDGDEWLWKWFQNQQKDCSSNNPWLLAAADETKDQSYFLAGCSNAQLALVLFPLGDLYKKEQSGRDDDDDQRPQRLDVSNTDKTGSTKALSVSSSSPRTVRALAAHFQLPTADKRESMGICFVGKRQSWIHFVRDYTAPTLLFPHVQFVDIEAGHVLGQSKDGPSHPSFYTIGRGARVGGSKEKYFVVGKPLFSPSNAVSSGMSAEGAFGDNVVWVAAGTHHPALYATSLTVKNFNWMIDQRIPDPLLQPSHHFIGAGKRTTALSCVHALRCKVRIRHLQELIDCEVVLSGDGSYYTINLDRPVRGITPGQMAVLYAGNGLVCLGGGPVASRGPTLWEQQQHERLRQHSQGQEYPPPMSDTDEVAVSSTSRTIDSQLTQG